MELQRCRMDVVSFFLFFGKWKKNFRVCRNMNFMRDLFEELTNKYVLFWFEENRCIKNCVIKELRKIGIIIWTGIKDRKFMLNKTS